LLGPAHEEGEVIRKAITGGRREGNRGGVAATHRREKQSDEGVGKDVGVPSYRHAARSVQTRPVEVA
jgi:hypothetical protein